MGHNQSKSPKSPNLTELYENDFKLLKDLCMSCLCGEEPETPHKKPERQTSKNTDYSFDSISSGPVANYFIAASSVLDITDDFADSPSMLSLNASMNSRMSHTGFNMKHRRASELRSMKRQKLYKSRSYIEKTSPIAEDVEESFFRNAFSDDEDESEEEDYNADFLMKSAPAKILSKIKHHEGNDAAKPKIFERRNTNVKIDNLVLKN